MFAVLIAALLLTQRFRGRKAACMRKAQLPHFYDEFYYVFGAPTRSETSNQSIECQFSTRLRAGRTSSRCVSHISAQEVICARSGRFVIIYERYSAQAAMCRHFDRGFRYPKLRSVKPTAVPNAESQQRSGDATAASLGTLEFASACRT